jgi:hypothetical protein
MSFMPNPFLSFPAASSSEPSALYWDIAIPHTSYLWIGELEFRETSGGVNVFATGTMFSTTLTAPYTLANSQDGNYTTATVLQNTTTYDRIGVQFSTPKTIREVVLTPHDNVGIYAPMFFWLRYSSDGTNYTPYALFTPATWVPGVAQTLTVPNLGTGTARYYLLATDDPAPSNWCIGEINMNNGGSNLFTGGTASAWSIYSAGFEASKAVDGGTGTGAVYANNGTKGWWRYDLGSGLGIATPSTLVLTGRSDAYAAESGLTKGLFCRSNDGSSYDVVNQIVPLLPWSLGQAQTFDLNATVPGVSDAARFWRVKLNSGGDGFGYFTCTALEMRETIGGSNAATGGTPYASSVYGTTSYPASNAFDGNSSTFWNSAGTPTPQYIAYDFGAGVTKNIVEVVWTYRDGQQVQAPTSITLQKSNDNVTWVDVFTYIPLPWYAMPTQRFAAPTTAKRQWRINNFTGPGDGGFYSVQEMEMRQSPGGADETAANDGAFAYDAYNMTTYAPSKAFDGTSGFYNTGSLGGYLGYDFGPNVDKDIVQIVITPRTGLASQTPNSFNVQSCTGDGTWTTEWSATAAAWVSGVDQTFNE